MFLTGSVCLMTAGRTKVFNETLGWVFAQNDENNLVYLGGCVCVGFIILPFNLQSVFECLVKVVSYELFNL